MEMWGSTTESPPADTFFLSHECNTILASIRALWVPGCRVVLHKCPRALLGPDVSQRASYIVHCVNALAGLDTEKGLG